MRSLQPRPGLSAPLVNIPDGPLTGEWFRSFLTNYLNPYALQGTQGQAVPQTQAPAPPFTTSVNSPLNAATTLANVISYPSSQSMWLPCQTVHLPDAVAFDVSANGGYIDMLLCTSTSNNGYIVRFDARSGQVAGQLLKLTNGSWTTIGAATAAANTEALGGTYRVVAIIGLNGAMSVYVDGELQCKAADTTYTPDGTSFIAASIAGTKVWAPTAIDGTLDFVADGAQYVHLASSHASNNVAYNFRGVWASGNSYVKGDEVVYGQTYWLALNPSTGSAPSTSNANWQAVASYNAYQGAWSASHEYVVGDEVTYSGNYWVCIADNTNSAPSLNNANWQIAGPTNLDQIADGSTYARVLSSYLAGNAPISINVQDTRSVNEPPSWYRTNYPYRTASEFKYASTIGLTGESATYVTLLTIVPWGDTSGGVIVQEVNGQHGVWARKGSVDDTSWGNWYLSYDNQNKPGLDNDVLNGTTYSKTLADYVALGVPYNFQGAYSNTTAYPKGAEVSSGGNYYLATAATTGNAPPNATYWQLLGPTSLDNVADGTTYSRVLAAWVTSGVPYNYQGAWSSATAYVKGAEVSSGGNYYLATTNNSNLPPASNPANWQLLGPTSLDSVTDGSSFQRSRLGVTLSGDLPYNGDMEQFADGQNVPDGWTQNYEVSGAGCSASRSTTAYSGSYSLSVGPNSASNGSAEVSRPFGVEPGKRYKLGCWVQSSVANPGSMYLRVYWFKDDVDLSYGGSSKVGFQDIVQAGGPTAASTWQNFSGIVQAPATARFARVALYNWVSAAGATLLFDRVSFAPYIPLLTFGNGASVANWRHMGTLVLNAGSTASFRWHAGSSYSSNGNQQSVATIIVRAGNDGAAPNLAGVTAWVQGGTNPFYPEGAAPYQLFLYATGGSTSATNTSWEIWMAVNAFTLGPLEVIVNSDYGDSFTFDGSIGTPPGYPGAPPASTWVGCTAAWAQDYTGRVAAYKGAISPFGCIPPGTSTVSFSYTSTTSSIDFAWTSGTIYRPDGTTTSVSAGNTNVTGLSASTAYDFAVYYDELNATVALATGAGAVGSPAVACTSKLPAVAAGMIANSAATFGWFSASTTASGSGGGGGPPTCCLNGEQLVELADGRTVRAADLTTSDYLCCPEHPVRITKLRVEPWPEWFRVTFNNGVELLVAADHRFVDPCGEEVRARELKIQQILRARAGHVCVTALELVQRLGAKVSIEVEDPHTYYVQGLLSHNKFMC